MTRNAADIVRDFRRELEQSSSFSCGAIIINDYRPAREALLLLEQLVPDNASLRRRNPDGAA